MSALQSAADLCVPKCAKGSFKFGWDEELNLLKDASVESNSLWKAAGKPRQGPLFSKRQSCRLMYRKWIKENQMLDTERYSNALHEALVKKKKYHILAMLALKVPNKEQLMVLLTKASLLINLPLTVITISVFLQQSGKSRVNKTRVYKNPI